MNAETLIDDIPTSIAQAAYAGVSFTPERRATQEREGYKAQMQSDYDSLRDKSHLERTQELFAFLQGRIPEGYHIRRKKRPKLTADQAWTVIWYLGNQYWQVTDHVERCEVCGDLYDSNCEGDCLDYGGAPYHFCQNCIEGNGPDNRQAYVKKMKRNPDKEERKAFFGR